MYNFIRKIHLYSGLVILTFLTMYFVTGYAIIHGAWFGKNNPKPAEVVRTESLEGFSGERSPEGVAHWAVERFGLKGRLNVPKPEAQPKNAMAFNVLHPGVTIKCELPNDSKTLKMTTVQENFAGTLNQLHRVHGYRGGWLYWTWALVNDLAAIACILFAISGVYLWWKSTTKHFWGWVCLGISCGYGFGMIAYLLLAR